MKHSSLYNQLIYLSFILVFASTAGVRADDTALLGAGDVVKITVYGQPDMTTVARIAESNKISFPLIGDVIIGGLSAANAEDRISRLLASRGFVRNAQINIFVEQRLQTFTNSVTILGQVTNPGKYSLQSATVEGVRTLVDLLAAAGGTNDSAADYLVVIKKNGDKQQKIRVNLFDLLGEGSIDPDAYKLNGGDVVFLPEMDVFYIYGQVQRPGRYRLEHGMTVMQALSVGGGITERGSERGIQIKRRSDGETKTFKANSVDELAKDDVIYVKESLF